MELIESIHAAFDDDAELPVLIPGGLHQDFVQDEAIPLPYAVAEDAGGIKVISSTDDGPEDQIVRFWVFDNDSDRGMAAARNLATKYGDLTLILGPNYFAYPSLATPIRFVTEEQLMKDVKQGYQISFEVNYQK